jgi:polysaccharide export outer membrane protein
MRKVLLFVIAVIVLVSLTWFKSSRAQDFGSLTRRNQTDLIKALGDNRVERGGHTQYQTPTLYDSTAEQAATKPIITSAPAAEKLAGLVPFESLRPFGQELFNTAQENTPPTDIATASDYVLGPGDNLVVHLWGRAENEYNLTVDRDGKVFIPKAGEIVAWGMTVDGFKAAVQRKLSAIYTDFQLTVSLGRIRSIRIYLTGEVNKPGAYTVSSLTSLFNALYLAQGPTPNGSMRDIRLMRSGKAVAHVDLYRFLLEGDNTTDVRLETGDAIFVPVAGPRVGIRGEIRRQAIYEIRSGETAMDLMALAGNATPEAHLDRVMLERIAGRDEWKVIDLNLNADKPATITNQTLCDGDRISVFSVFDARKNVVGIFGKIKHAGYYQRDSITRVADLLARGQLQDYDVHFDRANLFRRHSDWRTEIISVNLRAVLAGDSTANLPLYDRDSLHVYSIQDVKWSKSVSVSGEVTHEGEYPLYDHMTADDLIFLAGSFTRAASMLTGELARMDSAGNAVLSQFDLSNTNHQSPVLQEGDQVFVRRIPEWQLHQTVVLEGEVEYPGEYMLADRDETLYELIQRAGGFTPSAFPVGTILQRSSIAAAIDKMQIGSVLDRANPLVKDTLGNVNRSRLFVYDSNSVTRIALQMEENIRSKGRTDNVALRPGDRIYIPQVPSGISVLGAVGSNGTIVFETKKSVNFYIGRAGNFSVEADKHNTRLIKANGMVFAGKSTLNRRVDLGDVIVVPTRIKSDQSWTRTLTTITSTTVGILGSILVISKL